MKFDVTTGARLLSWQYRAHLSSTPHYSFGVGPSGNIYISGVNGGAFVAKYSPDGSLLKMWGGEGTGDGQFTGSKGVAVDATENVYVGDAGYNSVRVQKLTPDGVFLSAFSGTGEGSFGTDIFALATDPSADVFVLDSTQMRVIKFVSPTTPTVRHSWGALKTRYR